MYAFLRFPGFRNKALTLSYDDGCIYDKAMVEILDRYGIKCTFNLNSGLMGVSRRMSAEDCVELFSSSPHEVAVHGSRHLCFADIDDSLAIKDVVNDRETLESMFGRIVNGMAYAYGDYDDSKIEAIKRCGIVYSRTTHETEKFDIPTDFMRWPSTCYHKNPRLFQILDKFLDDTPPRHMWCDEPRLFYLFGHSYEFNDDNNWDLLEKFCERVGGRNDVFYATNMEIYEYVKAYDSLIFSYGGRIIKNPSSIDVYTNLYGKKIMIKAGSTVSLPDGYGF
ncbi:MAG: polysaccharide deacetylase family protein [Clostridia bacterium]|nr:polysaccharide deacetylase family protein [Clostridia bacterium]